MRVLILVLVAMLLAGCNAQPKHDSSLFTRLGGLPMLTRLSNQTLDIVSKDPRTARSFEGVKMVTLKQSLTNFLCLKTGGPCEYEGETMKNAHADTHITTAEFEIMVEVLRERMDNNGVGTKEKNELLKILAPMKRDVVSD